jgi:hypothetical protein
MSKTRDGTRDSSHSHSSNPSKLIKTPSPNVSFYDRYSKQLLATPPSAGSTSSPSKPRLFEAPKATFDDLLEEELNEPSMSGTSSNRREQDTETLEYIENRLKSRSDAVDEEKLLRQWFKLKNREQ